MTRLSNARALTAAVMVAAFLFALPPSAASACSCAPVTTAEMVENAEVVFVGQEVGRIANRDVWPPVAVSFQVVEAFKGEVSTEMTVWTGGGDADCGVGPLNGLVGVAAYFDQGRLSFNICGGVHDPGAVAAVIDPIELADSPDNTPAPAAGGSLTPWLVVGGLGAVVAATVLLTMRRRRQWHDGWDSSA